MKLDEFANLMSNKFFLRHAIYNQMELVPKIIPYVEAPNKIGLAELVKLRNQ